MVIASEFLYYLAALYKILNGGA